MGSLDGIYIGERDCIIRQLKCGRFICQSLFAVSNLSIKEITLALFVSLITFYPIIKTIAVNTTKAFILLCVIFLGCNQVNTEEVSSLKQDHTKINKPPKTIIIQPFQGFSSSSTDFVAAQLRVMYSGNIIVKDPIPFPKEAYNPDRARYRADKLIRFLGKLAKDNELIIGLTGRDISTTKGNINDWGVMGLGYCPGKSCIASTFRLRGNNRLEKLFKVAIHELGHTEGLSHCPEKTCLMRDAEGRDHLDEEKDFCPNCKPLLVRTGWALK